MVLASNRGLTSLNQIKLEEWCVCITRLEHFTSQNTPCEGIPAPIPTPVPTAGTPGDGVPSFVCNGLVGISLLGSIPDFGRFYGSHGRVLVDAVLAKNLPPRSRENEFTDGRVELPPELFF